jgi:hypothetical protein
MRNICKMVNAQCATYAKWLMRNAQHMQNG